MQTQRGLRLRERTGRYGSRLCWQGGYDEGLKSVWIRIRRIRMFWASWIRILLSSSNAKYSKKNLDSCCFVTSLWLFMLKMMYINVPSKSNKQKNCFKKYRSFLLASWRSRTKIAGSGAGSIGQRPGSGSVPKCQESTRGTDPRIRIRTKMSRIHWFWRRPQERSCFSNFFFSSSHCYSSELPPGGGGITAVGATQTGEIYPHQMNAAVLVLSLLVFLLCVYRTEYLPQRPARPSSEWESLWWRWCGPAERANRSEQSSAE